MPKETSKITEVLENALTELLKEHSFDDIRTTELVQKAGISRSNFYNHYRDKYEVIEQYQNAIFNQIEYIFQKNENDKQSTILEAFEFLNTKVLLSSLLSENGTKEVQLFIRHKLKKIIQKTSSQYMKDLNLGKQEEEYAISYIVSAVFGVFQTWISHNKKETPLEMTKLIMKLLPES